MSEITAPTVQAGLFVGEAPASGVVAVLATDGTVHVTQAWDPVQGDVTYTAPAGSTGGGGTRRHLFADTVVMSGTVGIGVFGSAVPGAGTGFDPTTGSMFDIFKTEGVSPEVSLRLRLAGFNHGMNLQDVLDSIGGIQQQLSANGGLTFYTYSLAAPSYRLSAIAATADTAELALSHAPIKLQASIKDLGSGTQVNAFGATANLIAVMNDANNVILIKANGQINSAASSFGFGSLVSPTNENTAVDLGQLLGTTFSTFSLATSRANADGQNIGVLSFDLTSNTANYKNRARIVAQSKGATANKRGAQLQVYVSQDNVVATTLAATFDTDLSLTIAGAFGCNGAGPQTPLASGGAIAAYGAGANGYDTALHAQEIHDMVVKIRSALVANGIMS